MIFWHGIHLPNTETMGRREFDLLRRAKFNACKAMIPLTSYDTIRRVRDDLGIDRWVLRLWYAGQPPSPDIYAQLMVRKIQEAITFPLAGCHVVIQVHNEPNHVAGVEGFGADRAWQFYRWYMATLYMLRYYLIGTGVRYTFPGLALNHPREDEWVQMLSQTRAAQDSDFLGVHCYWQGDNHLADMWGLHYKAYQHLQVPMMVLEYGDSSFENPPLFNPQERPRRVYEWLKRASPNLAGAFYFILGGTPDWKGFFLDEATADAMARFVEETP